MTAALAVAGEWGLVQIAIAIVVLLGICAVVYIAARAMGMPIPQWLVNIVAVVVIVIIAVVAIKFIASL